MMCVSSTTEKAILPSLSLAAHLLPFYYYYPSFIYVPNVICTETVFFKNRGKMVLRNINIVFMETCVSIQISRFRNTKGYFSVPACTSSSNHQFQTSPLSNFLAFEFSSPPQIKLRNTSLHFLKLKLLLRTAKEYWG